MRTILSLIAAAALLSGCVVWPYGGYYSGGYYGGGYYGGYEGGHHGHHHHDDD
jgi:hypothetical protein